MVNSTSGSLLSTAIRSSWRGALLTIDGGWSIGVRRGARQSRGLQSLLGEKLQRGVSLGERLPRSRCLRYPNLPSRAPETRDIGRTPIGPHPSTNAVGEPIAVPDPGPVFPPLCLKYIQREITQIRKLAPMPLYASVPF